MFRHPNWLLIFLFLLGIPLPGCGTAAPQVVVSGSDPDFQRWAEQQCRNVESDQWGLFLPPLDTHQVTRIGIDPRFSEAERTALLESIDVWNEYGQRTLGQKIFVGEIDAAVTSTLPGGQSSCDFESPDGSRGLHIVKIDSYENWRDYDLSDANPAVTIRCQTGSKLDKQIVLINTKLSAKSQLKSIMIHELGHTIGLNHSCISESKNGTTERESNQASCNGLASSHPYRLAVMYPILRMRATEGPGSEQKERLQENDEARASCVHRMTE